MKRTAPILMLLAIVLAYSSYGQHGYNISLRVEEDRPNNEKMLSEEGIAPPVYKKIEQIEKYLNENLKFSKKDYKTGLFGKNYFELKVDQNGKLLEAKCIKASVSSQTIMKLQKLLLRCYEWIPATKNGSPTEILFSITVTFNSA